MHILTTAFIISRLRRVSENFKLLKDCIISKALKFWKAPDSKFTSLSKSVIVSRYDSNNV